MGHSFVRRISESINGLEPNYQLNLSLGIGGRTVLVRYLGKGGAKMDTFLSENGNAEASALLQEFPAKVVFIQLEGNNIDSSNFVMSEFLGKYRALVDWLVGKGVGKVIVGQVFRRWPIPVSGLFILRSTTPNFSISIPTCVCLLTLVR